MMRKVSILILLAALGLSAELWVNAVRDPGAELGQGDWETDVYEWPTGAADSARVDAHDSSRAYEGSYSFLTDTDKDPGLQNENCDVWCYQALRVPKAVRDVDSCFWMVYIEESNILHMWGFYIRFHSKDGKKILWFIGRGSTGVNDSLCYFQLPLPDSGVWAEYGAGLYDGWTNFARWSPLDTIVEVQLHSEGWKDLSWMGQDVSWDNIVLRSIAYYDYAAKSIDSEEQIGQTYTPIATFANEGIKDDSSATVYAEILEGEAVVYKDSQEVSIPAESSEQVQFSEWTVPEEGSYTLRVYPILGLDEYSADDTLEQTLGGISENRPEVQPVTIRYTSSGVYFSFSSDIQGKLSMYDATGRKVHDCIINPGTRELFWPTEDVPSGLYFYKLKAGERASTGKLLVFK